MDVPRCHTFSRGIIRAPEQHQVDEAHPSQEWDQAPSHDFILPE